MFEHSFVVSLQSTPDRLAGFQNRAAKVGLDRVKPFPAITTPPGVKFAQWYYAKRLGSFGCYMSHNAIIRMAHAMSVEKVVIFEDDAEFDPDFKMRASELVSRLPDDWDIFYLGCIKLLGNVTDVAPGIVKTNEGGFGTHCYCVRGSSIPKIIDRLDSYGEAIDNILAARAGLNCYYASPSLSWQLDNVSTIDGELKKYGRI